MANIRDNLLMGYCLENKKETARLEKQSQLAQYDCACEFSGIKFLPSDSVMDAGCGTGLISRYLVDTYNVRSVCGFDASYQRIYDAKDLASGYNNIDFIQSDLCNVKSIGERFDKAVSRYVFQHLNDPVNAANEIKRLLKPNGQVIVIDTDGISFDLYTENKELNILMDKIKSKCMFDVYVGRKLPKILSSAGFVNIDWNITPMIFKKEDLEAEYQINLERFEFSKDSLIKILGSEKKYLRFKELYLEEMMINTNILFYNKFIVTASKP